MYQHRFLILSWKKVTHLQLSFEGFGVSGLLAIFGLLSLLFIQIEPIIYDKQPMSLWLGLDSEVS